MDWHALLFGRNRNTKLGLKPRFTPSMERLEDRTVPAIIASQASLSSLPPLDLTTGQVAQLLARAAAATSTDNAIVAVVDRNGDILGVRVEGNVSPAITGDTQILDFSIDGAVSLARTAAFFSSNADPLTSRTVGFISQSTITQREVEFLFVHLQSSLDAAAAPALSPPSRLAATSRRESTTRRRSTCSASRTLTAKCW